MECPSCGISNPVGKKFCGDCGASLPLACATCGMENPSGTRFCGNCGAALGNAQSAPEPGTSPSARPSSEAVAQAERRQVTVMFCDLVDWPALASLLDPEDLREVVSAFHGCVAAIVRSHDGFVAKYMGDGVLTYFGYPYAHEDDAEQAVRAGLALVGAVGLIEGAKRKLSVRVGISTGIVVVGDLIGSGPAQEQEVVGETPHLAARLQAIAEPNTVVIGPSTRRLLGGLFEYSDLGAVGLKGFAEPARAYRVLRPSDVESRFEALRSTELTPLFGRDDEMELLLRRWERAKAGEGQVVLVCGEPGIGKSRVAATLRSRIEVQPHTRLRYFCSPHHRDRALYPFIAQLEYAAGFARDDSAEAKFAKLEALLEQSGGNDASAIALVADLLGLPTDGFYPSPPADPQRRRELTLVALARQLGILTAQCPVLLTFEDAQWADSTSLELLDRLVEGAAQASALVLITFRPEFQAPWAGQAHVSSLWLRRLAERETKALVGAVAGGKSLPDEIINRIVDHADGIPLFIEELTRTLLEGGLLREEEGGYVLAGPLPPLAIPSSLRASLMARLDRLAPVKEVAQIGAALGREFSYELLAAVARRTDEGLRGALDQLVDASLVFRRGVPPRASFVFKHALVQDAAYSTLLRGQRQELHARIARSIEQRFPELVEGEPEILAHHYTQAGLADQAISYLARAGRRALDQSAMVEAASQLTKALALIPELPDNLERERRELDLQTALGRALMITKGYAAPETGKAYARARRLCEGLGDTATLVRVGYGQYLYHLIRAETAQCHQVASEILSFAEKSGSDEARILGHRTLGLSLYELGRFPAARKQLETAAGLLEQSQKHRMLHRGDAGVTIPAWLSSLLAFQGHLDHAARMRDLSVRESNASTSLHSRVFGLAHATLVSCLLREHDELRLRADNVCALATELDFPFLLAWGLIFRGIARLNLGRPDGEQAMRDGLALYRQTGSKWGLPFWLANFADFGCQGTDEAMAMVREGLEAVEATGERWYEAELYRLRGTLARSGASFDDGLAENDLLTARRIAIEQQAKLLELRAVVSLARLWRDQGRRVKAHELLAPVCGSFSAGFATADLKEAKALLVGLS
ncbi:MAG: AAA family ATPase [Rhodospirillales bacterium]|nr:AAA family ATPase [Rhodospirillales bacterium]